MNFMKHNFSNLLIGEAKDDKIICRDDRTGGGRGAVPPPPILARPLIQSYPWFLDMNWSIWYKLITIGSPRFSYLFSSSDTKCNYTSIISLWSISVKMNYIFDRLSECYPCTIKSRLFMPKIKLFEFLASKLLKMIKTKTQIELSVSFARVL